MSVNITIDVRTERTGPQPITMGIPFPRGSLLDAAELAFAGGPALAAKDVVRWGGGSIKWARLDFVAPAG
ncbi:MAG: hypothetical protein HQ559_14590, partial [Lentisphaerae bacterium]|nr:hypothetical protein [Lentisphaerota bacterium]